MATKLTEIETKMLLNMKPEDVMSVYSGKDGKCCCGCAGNHRYNSLHRVAAGKHRGYPLDKEDINNAQVTRVLRILQAHIAEATAYGNHFAVVLGARVYIVYPMALR